MTTVKKPIKSYNPNKTKAWAMASARAKENMKKKSLGQSTQSKSLVLEKPKIKPLQLEDPTKYQKDLFNMSKQDFNNKYWRWAHNKATNAFVPKQNNPINDKKIPVQNMSYMPQVNSKNQQQVQNMSYYNNNFSKVPNAKISMIDWKYPRANTDLLQKRAPNYNQFWVPIYIGGKWYTDGVYYYDNYWNIILQ